MAKRNNRAFAAFILAILVASAVGLWFFANHRPAQAEPGFEKAEVLYVVDGDTLYVSLAGEDGYVRLIGIDCPESCNPDETKNTPEGKAASDFTKSVVKPGMTVWMVVDVRDTDKYGRWLRYVWLDVPEDLRDIEEVRTKMLQGIILDAGHAVAKRYTPDTSYATIFERIAR